MVLDAAKDVETHTRKLFEVYRLHDVPIITFSTARAATNVDDPKITLFGHRRTSATKKRNFAVNLLCSGG